jgi:hypothetical protein
MEEQCWFERQCYDGLQWAFADSLLGDWLSDYNFVLGFELLWGLG